MSLNRFEQTLFGYWEAHPDERRHWQAKVSETARTCPLEPGGMARELERELWQYFVERTPHVPAFRELNATELRRISLLNLADYLIRLWGVAPKPKKTSDRVS